MNEHDRPAPTLPLFTGEPVDELFCQLGELLPTTTMPPSGSPLEWPEGALMSLPETYEFEGSDHSVEGFLGDTDTAALLVLQDGEVRHERYELTGGPEVRWISWSVAKSFMSALVGIALDEGAISSLDDPISDYIEVQNGSAYDGVAIRDVLQMASGARWYEDYSDPASDIHRLGAAILGPGTLDEFVATASPESAPGTVCRYNSADTQALAPLVANATGHTIADYMHEKLLDPLGATSSSAWLIDTTGREVGAFGLTMTARDFARLGELYRNGGEWQGRQIISRSYVEDSVRPHGAITERGAPWLGDHHIDLGYGYQWWLPETDPEEFCAIGVYNQLVYVHPESRSVIVKLSANRAYGTSSTEATNRDVENTAFLRSIARHLL